MGKKRRRGGKHNNAQQSSDEEQETEDDSSNAVTKKPKKFLGHRVCTILADILEYDFGLLDEMLSQEILTYQQKRDIQAKPSKTRAIGKLIDQVSQLSSDKQQQFLVALKNSGQTHVANFITHNGNKKDDCGEDWPLMECEQIEKFQKCQGQMISTIDPSNGLLDKMLSSSCINMRQKSFIEASETTDKQNEKLLSILCDNSIAAYNKFLKCLGETNQSHVVSLLAPEQAGGFQILSENRKNRLIAQFDKVIDAIDPKNGLLGHMISSRCITPRQMEYIQQPTYSTANINKRLLELMTRSSEQNFDKFLDCLSKSGQPHVSDMLTNDLAIAHVIVNMNDNVTTREDEEQIVQMFRNICRSGSPEQKERLLARLNHCLPPGVELLAIHPHESLGMLFLTKSLLGLQRLYDMFLDGSLKIKIKDIFLLLLNDGRSMNISRLNWKLANYTSCIQHFCSMANLPIFTEIYTFAHQTTRYMLTDDFEPFGWELTELPYELVEMILIKTAGQLFVDISQLHPRAELYAMATMFAVSHNWWYWLTYREFIKNQLKTYFSTACQPFISQPRLHPSIPVLGVTSVMSVTILNDRLYAVGFMSNTIQVFNYRAPFQHFTDIKVPKMQDPSDIAACHDTNQLYISDCGTSCVWRIDLKSDELPEMFVALDYQSYTISVRFGRLIVTAYDDDAMFVYGKDGKLIRRIALPDFMEASHAIETAAGNYIVSHYASQDDDADPTHHSVSEINAGGQVLKVFRPTEGLMPMNEPRYLATEPQGHLLIADRINERVLVLTAELQLKRILIPAMNGQPSRLCYSAENGLLFVVKRQSTNIDVYKVAARSKRQKEIKYQRHE